MNARADSVDPTRANDASAGRAEHISLEGDLDPGATPARQRYRKVRSRFVLTSRLRRCSTELSLLDDDYLQVHAIRSREQPKKYVIDLRFLNSQPVRLRHVAWIWLVITLSALALSAGASVWVWSHASGFASSAFAVACAGAGGALGSTLLFLRFTSEALNFTSLHGGATLVSVVGGPGSTKRGKQFFVAMIKAIGAAKAARQQPKQQWLRDEMREHHRLRELGVLSDAQYEESKTRILKAHA